MADIFAAAGTKVYIGPAMASQSADFVVGDFETSPALTYVEIDPVENIGQFGDASQAITFDALNRARRMKLKGTRDAGDLTLICGSKPTDAGQVALIAAEKASNDYAFKVVFNDMPSGGTSGSIRYFIAKVMSRTEQVDTANNVVKLNATLGINSNIVPVAAV